MGSCPSKQTTNRQFAAALRERSTIKSAFNRATNNNDEDMLIPPGPNTKTKDDILPSPEILELIDVHVSETPADACVSVASLTDHLTSDFDERVEKVKAIHRWITTNIRFDVQGFQTREFGKSTAEDVLRKKCTGYHGYCNLFAAMCRSIGIPVRTIEGYGKDDTNIEEVAFDLQSSEINHAWNVVHIGDEWRFVDCTWDAGYIDETGKFQWLCNDFYFLTNPDFFGVKHFPYMNDDLETSKQWQLVDETMDLETFSRRAIIHEYAMENGIGLVTHGETLIEVISETTIIISGPSIPIEDVSCEMEEIYQFDNVVQDQYTMAERMGHDGVKIKLRVPTIATYILRIFAKMFSKDNEFGKVATYIVKCLQVSKDMELFPSHGIWGPELYYQDIGFEKAIVYQWWYEAACGEIDLYVPVWEAMEIVPRLQSSEDVDEVVNSVLIQTDSRSIVAIARLPKRGNYKLTISKKMPNGSVVPAIHYLITCKHGYVPFMPFPIAFPVVQQFMITLVEPKKRFLPARSYVRFRIISPLLHSLRLGEQTFSKRLGDKWDFTIVTPGPDEDLLMYGGTSDFRTSIFCFRTVLFVPEPHVCERLIRTSQSRRSINKI